MKTYICTILIALTFYGSAFYARAQEVNSYAELKKSFANPSIAYSTAPFFVWNGEMTESDIDQFLADYKAQGIKAFFIHPRPGMITPYLSDRWFELCRYAVKKAKGMGMQVWLYDENSYPSGFAGGHVPAEMPESWNQGQGLIPRLLRKLDTESAAKCKVLLKLTDEGRKEVTSSITSETGKEGSYICYEVAFYGKSPWYGGYSYVDLIKPGVTEKFIELTMKEYERSLGSEFGKTVPGIFTDEPNILSPQRGAIRWTPDLFEQFEKRWGYKLSLHLPSLFENVGDWRRVRHNYFELLLELFVDRWTKPWIQYTSGKKLIWTGHYYEHEWPNPVHEPDHMPLIAQHPMPGIDLLFNQFNDDVNAQFGNVRIVKELASVGNQMGRRRRLCEIYGGGGWELRFEDMKRLGDWAYALGVNFMNQHLSHQTLVGARKYDYPQSFGYQTPWWKHYRLLADYYARLSLALSTGEQRNRILVLEPSSSTWLYASVPVADKRIMDLGRGFQQFLNRLESLQVEYDLGSEYIMKDVGKASRGQLIVGQRAYDLVIIPPGTENLNSSTVRLLTGYLRSGGRLLSFTNPPPLIDGAESESIKKLSEQYSLTWIQSQSLDDLAIRDYLLAGDFKRTSGLLFHQRRKAADGDILFFVNSSLDQPAQADLEMKGKSVIRLDPLTGNSEVYPSELAKAEKSKVRFSISLPPAGSLLLVVTNRVSVNAAPASSSDSEREILADKTVMIERSAPNVIRIDYCDLKLSEKTERGLYYYKAGEKVFKYHGFASNPWNTSVQYKTSILDRNKFDSDSGYEATFGFEVANGVDKAVMKAVVERPELWEVLVNGKAVTAKPGAWWLDVRFGVYDISSLVIDGKNSLTLRAHPMSVHHELEPIYILGNFGVAAQSEGWKLIPVSLLKLGQWKDQSLPFYSDRVAYTHTYHIDSTNSRYYVELGRWNGTTSEVLVNGVSAGLIGWQPYRLEISKLLKVGENQVEVQVYGSLKNLLGPHHGKINRGLTSPWSFRNAPDQQPSGGAYDMEGYGLIDDFKLKAQGRD